MRGVRCSGINLVVLYIPATKWETRHVFVLLPLRIKRRGLVILIDFFLSTLRHLSYCDTLFLANLIPWDACWIAVLGWSISSRCSWINGLLITDVMPIWDYAMNDHSHTHCYALQLPNCLVCLIFKRDISSEPMAPESTFPSIQTSKNSLHSFPTFVVSLYFYLFLYFVTSKTRGLTTLCHAGCKF